MIESILEPPPSHKLYLDKKLKQPSKKILVTLLCINKKKIYK